MLPLLPGWAARPCRRRRPAQRRPGCIGAGWRCCRGRGRPGRGLLPGRASRGSLPGGGACGGCRSLCICSLCPALGQLVGGQQGAPRLLPCWRGGRGRRGGSKERRQRLTGGPERLPRCGGRRRLLCLLCLLALLRRAMVHRAPSQPSERRCCCRRRCRRRRRRRVLFASGAATLRWVLRRRVSLGVRRLLQGPVPRPQCCDRCCRRG